MALLPVAAAGFSAVATVRDATYPTGQVWIGASDLESDPAPVDIRFDNLVLRSL